MEKLSVQVLNLETLSIESWQKRKPFDQYTSLLTNTQYHLLASVYFCEKA